MRSDEFRLQAMKALEYQLPELLSREPEKRPHASTWFNQDRWADTPEPDPQMLVRVNSGGVEYDYGR